MYGQEDPEIGWLFDKPLTRSERKSMRSNRRFPELYVELREHCGYSDLGVAHYLGINIESLMRNLERNGLPISPELRAAHHEDKLRKAGKTRERVPHAEHWPRRELMSV